MEPYEKSYFMSFAFPDGQVSGKSFPKFMNEGIFSEYGLIAAEEYNFKP